MKGILGKKIGMLQLWAEDGRKIGVTALYAGPCSVLQIKKQDKDGYDAVQIGYSESKEKHLSRADMGHQKPSFEKNKAYYSKLIELRNYAENVQVGDYLDCTIFSAGDKVMVSANSKGKGFQSVIKRHGFGGGKKSHGSTFHRETGSVGAGNDPGRIHKGKRMPGRMGGKKITVRNLKVFKVSPEDNLILVEGSVPGANGSPVFVYQL
ncbi:MAG: 50S ribosomal protein L3 [Spirochaetia bacterium]|nr:50S ribosomal protein L3 [Spirochaetia bacterium]